MTRDELRQKLKTWAPWIGYPIFFLFCLFVFAIWTFPYNRLKERLVAGFNAQQKSGRAQQELQIDDLSSWWLTGVKAKGVRLVSAPPDPASPPVVLSIDEARVRVSVLPLLIGHRNVSFSLDAFDGEIDGTFEDHGKERVVEVELDKVDLSKVGPVTATLGVPVDGRISGKVALTMPEGRASKGTGSVQLEAADVAIGDGKAKIKGMLALPKLVVGNLSFEAEAKEGVLRITKFAASGKDVDLSGEGRIQMRELAVESICDINVKFKIADAYRSKNDVTKSLFGAPGSNAPALFDMADAKIRQAKQPDGSYAFHVRGLLGRPDFAAQTGGGGASMPSPFGFPR